MGQSPSAALSRENSFSDRFGFSSSSGFVSSDGFSNEFVPNRDYTAGIPDECLAYVFQFLGPGDRNRCSLVCKRWLCVDGWSRHRLSLNAQSEIFFSSPSLFTRFDSVTKLTLRCSRKSISLNDDALVMISIRCRNLERLKLRGCREISNEGMLAFAQNSKNLRKLSCGSCMFGAKALNAVLDYCANFYVEYEVNYHFDVQEDGTDGGAKRLSFQFQCVTWKLEKTLGKIPYDQYQISEEVQEQVSLVRAQLRRATERYGSLNLRKVSNALSQPLENHCGSTNSGISAKLDNISIIQGTTSSRCDADPTTKLLERVKSSSTSSEVSLLDEIDLKRLDTVATKCPEETKKPDALVIPEDFCNIPTRIRSGYEF